MFIIEGARKEKHEKNNAFCFYDVSVGASSRLRKKHKYC